MVRPRGSTRRNRPAGLSNEGTLRLFRVLLHELVAEGLPPPKGGEGEDTYTDRAIAPLVQGVLDRSRVTKLLLGGHHTGINRPTRYLGMGLHPDLIVLEAER